MVGDFKFSRPSRQCSVQQRALLPGEIYYSVLLPHDDDFERRDISQAAWEGPPDEAVGWWKNRVPKPDEKRREVAPPEVLVDWLHAMADQPHQAKTRYLLALLLLRKRHLREATPASIGMVNAAAAKPSTDHDRSTDQMCLESTLDGRAVQVTPVSISPAEATSLQNALVELIYRDVDE